MAIRVAALILGLLVVAGGMAQDKDRDSKLTPKQKSAARRASEAAKLMQMAEWDRGIRLCDAALRLDPDNVGALWMRGLAYLKKNDPDQAIADFSNALKRDAKMAPSYRDRGLAYAQKKEFDKAISDFTAYVKIRPTDPDGYHERALAYEAKGMKDKAAADMRKAKELRDKAGPKK
jgi:tetratricopeptide (TPR) repeat protein